MFHLPVMVKEVIDYLYHGDGIYLDCTAGGGGHLSHLLAKLDRGRIVAIDQDPDAIQYLRGRFQDPRLTIVHGNFSNLSRLSKRLGIEGYDGILFDLGLSRHQIETSGRGFSFERDGPLDMRMDPSLPLTARDLIRRSTRRELSAIIRSFGEDPRSGVLARIIWQNRKRIETTFDLRRLIEQTTLRRYRKKTLHRVFQAFRIAVNHELDNLKIGLDSAYQLLNREGRIVCISYHSLEDRIVKRRFKSWPGFETLTPKPVRPTEEEKEENPSSRSARLRAGRRL